MRITKNAVVGKGDRLGLPARRSPIRRVTPESAGAPQPPQPPQPRRGWQPLAPGDGIVPLPSEPRAGVPLPAWCRREAVWW